MTRLMNFAPIFSWSSAYIANELCVFIDEVLEEQIQESLQVGHKELWDIVAIEVVINLGQKVQRLEQDTKLRDVACVLCNHVVCGLFLK